MTCLDCKYCDIKDNIKYSFIDGSTYVCFKCTKHIETPIINTEEDEEICCKDYEEIKVEHS